MKLLWKGSNGTYEINSATGRHSRCVHTRLVKENSCCFSGAEPLKIYPFRALRCTSEDCNSSVSIPTIELS